MSKIFQPYGGPRRPHPGLYTPPGGEEPPPDPGDNPLFWPPPALTNPVVYNVSTTQGTINLSAGVDYIVRMPSVPRPKPTAIVGGRNVVLQGGEIKIDNPASNTIPDRRGLLIRGQTGIIHIEGLWIHGLDITEGIQIDAHQAIVQLENVLVEDIRAHDEVGFSDNHPDIVQTYGNVGSLRIDHFSGKNTDYQGLFFSADYNNLVTGGPGGGHGPIDVRNTNITGKPNVHRYLFWNSADVNSFPVYVSNVWVTTAGRAFNKSVWPDIDASVDVRPTFGTDATGPYAEWPATMKPRITGRVYNGSVPDFVVAGINCGIGYVSPWGNR